MNEVLGSKPNEKSHRINMPCLFNIGEPRYRIVVLISGYDEPL
ncbi:MAG: hypothetical protein QXS24_00320 [Desulfurococcaceae archaeon]